MATDRQLSANFRLSEFPCYWKASESEVERLQETVQRVLQPVRNRWGPTVPTSWLWWSDGCTPREGSHAGGGTVDFVVPGADLRAVFSWGVQHLLPSGYIGRWIYEPDRSEEEGTPQGEHIHVATRSDHRLATGDGRILALVETSEGSYKPAAGTTWDGYTGRFGDPIPVEGITTTATARLWPWLILGAGIGLALTNRKRRP